MFSLMCIYLGGGELFARGKTRLVEEWTMIVIAAFKKICISAVHVCGINTRNEMVSLFRKKVDFIRFVLALLHTCIRK